MGSLRGFQRKGSGCKTKSNEHFDPSKLFARARQEPGDSSVLSKGWWSGPTSGSEDRNMEIDAQIHLEGNIRRLDY